jgi:hypothetical protein
MPWNSVKKVAAADATTMQMAMPMAAAGDEEEAGRVGRRKPATNAMTIGVAIPTTTVHTVMMTILSNAAQPLRPTVELSCGPRRRWPARARMVRTGARTGRRSRTAERLDVERAAGGPAAAAMWLGGLPRVPDANAVVFDDPKSAKGRLGAQKREKAGESLEKIRDVLSNEAKYDDSGMRFRRVRADVGEVGVKCQERALLALARCEDNRVAGPAELLFGNSTGVEAGLPEQGRGLDRDILVELELHAAKSGRNG